MVALGGGHVWLLWGGVVRACVVAARGCGCSLGACMAYDEIQRCDQ